MRTLREGGEGRVVLAYQPSLSRWLAVKFVRLEPGARSVGEGLLRRLAAYAKEMLEPAVAPILASGLLEVPFAPSEVEVRGALRSSTSLGPSGFGLQPGLYLYIVMPYVHALPAHELAGGPLGVKEAAALFTGAAKLLARLHRQGLLHLDLKPANVLVDVHGRVVLVDPLLALVHGTSAYSAPEPDPSQPADRYALGRLVAAVWTGRYPQSAREGLPELPEPAVQLSGKERLAHGRFRLQLEQLARDPAQRELDIAGAEAFTNDLGAADGAADLAAQVERRPFAATLADIEKAQATRGGQPPSIRQDGGHEEGRLNPWPLVLGLGLAAGIVVGGEWWLHRPAVPAIDPPLAAATVPDPDIAFSKDAPERHGVAVRLGDTDTVAVDRALFKMRVPSRITRIAILGHDDLVADEILYPVRGQVYRWDVQPGSFNYEVDRQDYGPDIEPMFLEPSGKRLIEVKPKPSSAPIP